MVEMARIDGYAGRLYPVNPAYREIAGLPAFPSLDALPERVEHVVLGVANARLETALAEAIAHGARAATIFASCRFDEDADPPLAERIADKAAAAGLTLCGGSSMGFYNRSIGLRVAAFPSPSALTPGGIVWIAQSGSVFSALAHNDRRLGFALAVSTGMEMTTTVADYIDWALSRPDTKVIGLFLEGVRAPGRFRAALARAAECHIPVVALKVGRTQRSAAMAATHTGALAGNDAAWRALFRHYGVSLVDDLDEMAASLQLFEQPRPIGQGGLAAIHDSGGERELLVDLAELLRVPFAPIGAETRAKIAARLEPGLLPENPLDAWGTAADYVQRSADCFTALLEDPATAIGIAFSDPRDDYWYSAGVADWVRQAALRGGKPVALASNTALADNATLAMRLRANGVPLMIGTRAALVAARNAFTHRDFRARAVRGAAPPQAPAAPLRERWRARLAEVQPLLEGEALDLLGDYGVTAVAHRTAASLAETIAAAEAIGYPLALKTAEGRPHKSEAGGVRLRLGDRRALVEAYRDPVSEHGCWWRPWPPRAWRSRWAPSTMRISARWS